MDTTVSLPSPVRASVRLVVGLLAAALSVSMLPSSAAAAPGPVIGQEFFGVHHGGLHAEGPIGWPQTRVGSVRLWDNGVSWRELETAPGVFDWTLLDAHMAKARTNGASVLLVLGQTPEFYSSNPTVPGFYGPGASAMPASRDAWVRYVQTVAERNKTVWGGVADFQVWNEANVVGFWSGSAAQMATLTAWTRSALKAVDPSATLVAPALVTRLSSQRAWVQAFYGRKVAGKNVSAYVDALSFQLYPLPGGAPEASMKLLAAVRSVLAKHKIRKPIWNTEVNYGLVGGPAAGASVRQLPTERQVGNVLRTFTLNAQNGVRRVYWYSWDLLAMSNTALVEADRTTLTPAGRSFETARVWLAGTRPAGCAKDRRGVLTCAFKAGTSVRRVVWHPTKKLTVRAPAASSSYLTWDGASRPAKKGTKVRVGPVPVLLRGRR